MNNINNSIKIEMLCELAHNRVEEIISENGKHGKYIKSSMRGHETTYTDKGQTIFNKWYDYYDSVFDKYKGIKQ